MCAKLRTICAAVGMSMLFSPSLATAQESATAEEVIQKTREAADYLTKNKEAGTEAFKTMKSQFVWKNDGYVFVLDCAAGTFLANPDNPGVNGTKLSEIRDD